MSTQPRHSYTLDDLLSPHARDTLRHLELLARRTAQSLLHGSHRSKRRGVSTEFDHHKLYQPGDPLKHLDWKASARHDRYYVKRYLEDTSLIVRVVVDRSASMVQATDGVSKYLQACRVAACLAYLAMNQGDSAALTLACDREVFWLQPGSTERHLVNLLTALVSRQPAAPDALLAPLKTMLDRSEKRGLVIVISDLMFDPNPVQRLCAQLDAQGHELLVIQVRDLIEQQMPFNRWVQFGDLEDASVRLRLDTTTLRAIYQQEYQAVVDQWQSWCARRNIHWISFSSEESVATVVSNYMAFRAELEARR